MSIRTLPQQFRIACDLGLSPDCSGFSRHLFSTAKTSNGTGMEAQIADYLAKEMDGWRLEGAGKHSCAPCRKKLEEDKKLAVVGR